MNINEVSADDFLKVPKEKPSHVKIEEALILAGGQGVQGAKFKKEVMKLAGWKYGDLISYGAHADTAAEVFNKVRKILEETQEKDEIVQRLQ